MRYFRFVCFWRFFFFLIKQWWAFAGGEIELSSLFLAGGYQPSSLFPAGGYQLSVGWISQLSSQVPCPIPGCWEPPAGAGVALRALCLELHSPGSAVQIVLVDQALHFCAPLLSTCTTEGIPSLQHGRGRSKGVWVLPCADRPCRHFSQGWNGFATATEGH